MEGETVKQGAGSSIKLALLLLSLIVAAIANNVTSKLAYDAYGQIYAPFVNQASNFTYLFVSGTLYAVSLARAALRKRRRTHATTAAERAPLLHVGGGGGGGGGFSRGSSHANALNSASGRLSNSSSINAYEKLDFDGSMSKKAALDAVADGDMLNDDDVERAALANEDVLSGVQKFKILLVLGALDAGAGFLGAVGSVHTPGAFQVILNQVLIPITMLISFLVLRHRYAAGEMGGAAVIVLGASLTVGPAIVSGKETSTIVWYSLIIFAAQNVPSALSSVYKERALKGTDFPILYLTFFVALYQFLITLTLFPLTALPGFGAQELSSIPRVFYEGILCSAGIDSNAGDQCTSMRPILYFICYTVVNFMYNILGLLITQHGSAALAALAYALQIPAVTAVFAICPLMKLLHDACQHLNTFAIVGNILVLVGFTIHSVAENIAQRRREQRAMAQVHTGELPSPQALLGPKKHSQFRNRWVHSAMQRGGARRDALPTPPASANFYFSRLADYSIGGIQRGMILPEDNVLLEDELE